MDSEMFYLLLYGIVGIIHLLTIPIQFITPNGLLDKIFQECGPVLVYLIILPILFWPLTFTLLCLHKYVLRTKL